MHNIECEYFFEYCTIFIVNIFLNIAQYLGILRNMLVNVAQYQMWILHNIKGKLAQFWSPLNVNIAHSLLLPLKLPMLLAAENKMDEGEIIKFREISKLDKNLLTPTSPGKNVNHVSLNQHYFLIIIVITNTTGVWFRSKIIQ